MSFVKRAKSLALLTVLSLFSFLATPVYAQVVSNR